MRRHRCAAAYIRLGGNSIVRAGVPRQRACLTSQVTRFHRCARSDGCLPASPFVRPSVHPLACLPALLLACPLACSPSFALWLPSSRAGTVTGAGIQTHRRPPERVTPPRRTTPCSLLIFPRLCEGHRRARQRSALCHIVRKVDHAS